jgi:aspartyl-tRNA(Asn)/glutamyl-tRNA(Gln) amidotransferase subunit A
MAAASRLEAAIRTGVDPGPLAGVPIAIKDNLLAKGHRCSCGSRMLEAYEAPYDAHVVEKLVGAGAVVIGRTNMDEFSMGSSSETCAWGPVRNPLDLDRVPGGSSGGSAVAVAGGAVPLALGSDTGGSVRQPAALSGVVGFKPTYGRISRRGLVAFASSADQVGTMGRRVEDVALLTEVIAGHDPMDATSSAEAVPSWVEACESGVQGLKFGIPKEIISGAFPASIREVFAAAVDTLRAAGADVVQVSVPSLDLAVACYYVITSAEASSNLARFDGMRYSTQQRGDSVEDVICRSRSAGFGREVQRRILVGTYVLSAGSVEAYYRQAQRVRSVIGRELRQNLRYVDALLTPTAPNTAFHIGELTDPVSMYLQDVFTIPASLAGLPAISVPCGLVASLPVGLQIVGRDFDETTCFAAAAAVEASPGSSLPSGAKTRV